MPMTDEEVRAYYRRPAVIKPGGIYCAPRCGFGCKRVAFDRATREAAELVELLGPGWKPHVWENCGWHYEAVRGVLRVRPGVVGSTLDDSWQVMSYSCWIQTSPQYIETGYATPALAIRAAMMKMKAAFDALRDSFHETYAIGQQMGVIDDQSA